MALIGYVTEEEYILYASARNVSVSANSTVELTLALDWLELQPFDGERTDDEQTLEFPRGGETEIPDKIKTAQMVAGILIHNGYDFFEVVGSKVKREKVDVLEVEYADNSSQVKYFPQLVALLSGYLKNSGGIASFDVVKV